MGQLSEVYSLWIRERGCVHSMWSKPMLYLLQASHVKCPAPTTWPGAPWPRRRRTRALARAAAAAAAPRPCRPRRLPPPPATTARTTCAASRRPRTTSPAHRAHALYLPERGLGRECHYLFSVVLSCQLPRTRLT